ncbi:MAG: spore coat protein CotJB [Clostridia bacterium]|nr:spore coat protein CotJB [Clostridia bacterium]
MKEQKQLIKSIQVQSFSMLDTALFLDTHPCDADAMAKYTSTREELAGLINTYEMRFGPLTTSGNYCTDSWQWIESPWPWERQV